MESLETKEASPVKILFLDVDGVLNSYRNVAAYRRFPHPNRNEEELDPIAMQMIRRLCKELDMKIVLSSTWRICLDGVEWGKKWNLPIIASTRNGDKGDAIKWWLAKRTGVKIKDYVIIDDDNMRDQTRQVWTSIMDGFLHIHYEVITALMGEKNSLHMHYSPEEISRVYRGPPELLLDKVDEERVKRQRDLDAAFIAFGYGGPPIEAETKTKPSDPKDEYNF